MVVTSGRRQRGMESYCLMDTISVWDDEKLGKLIVRQIDSDGCITM